jgi:hypothetical protein
MRLHDMLKEALTPIQKQLEKMEQEIKILQVNQEELKRLLTELHSLNVNINKRAPSI